MNEANTADGQARPAQPGGTDRTPFRESALFGIVAVCVFAGLLLFYGRLYPIHQDLAGSLLSGRLSVMLGESFRDYSVYFPPAERVWFSLATRLSDLTGLRPDLFVVALSGAMVLFGAGLAYRIRRTAVGASPLFFMVPVAVLVIMPIVFKNVFGLREHMVALGLWPYLVLRVSDPEGTRIGRKLRVVVGLWMGTALLFKYLYSVVVVLVELADAFVQRRPSLLLRIENIIAGAVVFLYLLAWLGLDPSQREAIGAMRSAIEANLANTATAWLNLAENLYLAVILLISSRSAGVPQRMTLLALAAVVGSVFTAWYQERWYTHHLLPIILAYIAWLWIVGRRLKWWIHGAVALLILIPVSKQFLATSTYHEPLAELEKALAAAKLSVAGKRVALLNVHPSPYNEYLVSRGALRWTPLMNNSYVAAELERFDRPENTGKPTPPVRLDDPGRRMLHDQMLRMWEDMPPDVLILDRSSRWPLRYIDIDWNQAFSRDARFNAILKRYRPVLVHDGARLKFTYYVRAD